MNRTISFFAITSICLTAAAADNPFDADWLKRELLGNSTQPATPAPQVDYKSRQKSAIDKAHFPGSILAPPEEQSEAKRKLFEAIDKIDEARLRDLTTINEITVRKDRVAEYSEHRLEIRPQDPLSTYVALLSKKPRMEAEVLKVREQVKTAATEAGIDPRFVDVVEIAIDSNFHLGDLERNQRLAGNKYFSQKLGEIEFGFLLAETKEYVSPNPINPSQQISILGSTVRCISAPDGKFYDIATTELNDFATSFLISKLNVSECTLKWNRIDWEDSEPFADWTNFVSSERIPVGEIVVHHLGFIEAARFFRNGDLKQPVVVQPNEK